MTQLVTGEAVALDLRPAALPSRLVAAALDGLAQSVLLFGFSLLLAATTSGGLSSAAMAALTIVMLVLVLAGYSIAFESLWRGRTPGKAAMGLRVVRDDGGPVAFRQALVRGLAGLFLEKPGLTLFSGAVVSSLLNRDSKRLGDLLAGTIVLQERIPSKVSPPVPMPPPLQAWAEGLDLSGLPNDLAQSVRSFIARTPELTDRARDDLGGKLVAAVGAVVTPPAPPGTPGWAYLAAILAERRRRAELQLTPATGGLEATPGSAAPPLRASPPESLAPSAPSSTEEGRTSTPPGFTVPS